MEGKKISFGFMKTKKVEKPQVEENKEHIACLEETSIKFIGGVKLEESLPIVIPMKPNTLVTAEKLKEIAEKVEKGIEEVIEEKVVVKEEIIPENETLEQMALRELLRDAKKEIKVESEELTLPIPDKLIAGGAKESTLEDYESIPIQDFGIAMLRGMGWDANQQNGVKVEESLPIVIPMKPNTFLTAEKLKEIAEKVEKGIEEVIEEKVVVKEEIIPENETLEQMALRELLRDAKKEIKVESKELTLPIPDKLIAGGAKESTLEDYESIPIQDFGMAMLRGMGWDANQQKNRKFQFTPSTGIIPIQSTVAPQNAVPAEIEFLGFTPSSTTSTAAPDSGRSAYELGVEIDFERDFIEPGEGSDMEHEEYLDISLTRNVADDNPIDSDSLADPSLVEALRNIDAEADLALRTVLDPGPDQDLLSFDWRCEPNHFEGAREVFNVPSPGPTFENADLTPLEIFLKIWDADLIAHIVRETNRYGAELVRRNQKPNSRLQRWKNVTDDEIKVFLAIIMLQSLVIDNVEREYWYPKLDELRIGNFGAIMPYNRFLAIKRCIHFADNSSLPEHPNRLHKIMPIIERLNEKFSSLYLLEQNIAIDESLLLWKGRLSFSQKIATKKARVGIKSYELYESRTGYLWRMEVYSGKGHIHVAQVGTQEPVEEHEEGGEPESATSQIVLTLMRPLFNRGHTLVMDSFYNAPLLSRILKVKYKTDSMGTLRLDREFVPEGLRKKAKKYMNAGEVAFSSTKDLSVVVWMDKSMVSMISTYHQVKVGGIEKYGNYKYKPQVILDYNLSMGGIDHKNQMLHAYPIERVRNIIWYKKLFRRLINVTIHNCFVLFNHNRTPVLGNREFRLQLVKELLQTCRPGALPLSLVPAAPAAPSQMHLPIKNKKPQRCKLCNAAKVRRTTVWRCSTCAVNLCIEGCYTDYHK